MMKSPPPVDMRMLLIASIEFAERGGDQVKNFSLHSLTVQT